MRAIRHLSIVIASFLATMAAAQSGPVVRFAGPVNQDGCPFCCEFSCQRTPTPTPEIDAQGRRVFRRSTGQFLMVVEAGLGTSNRQVGSEGVFSGNTLVAISDPSSKPSMMMLSERKLGNGSPQIDCRTLPLGGVPGFSALDFNAGSAVTTALADMACRFEFAQSSQFACTRNRYGDFAFLSSSTARQFCAQIGNAAAFPTGRTTVAVQLRDTSGNLGPRYEFVVVVDPNAGPTTTPTRTPTATPRPASLAGAVRFYASTRPVPAATVRSTGSAARSVTTSSSGGYAFTDMPAGTVTIEPRKVGDFGSPTAISALDAAWVLQAVAGIRTFDARQRLACDVSGNGTLSALDAANILQRQVGILSRFAVATKCDSDWLFEPVASAAAGRRLIQPAITAASCQRGGIAYEPLATDQTQQDFLGILFGDCTGNWQPAGGAALQAVAPGRRPEVRLRVSRRTADGMIRVPIAVDAPADFYAVDLTIDLGPGLRAVAVRPLRAAAGALMVSNLTDPRRARIAFASGQPLQSAAILVLDIAADENAAGDVRLLRALIDDEPAVATTGASRVDG
ncbi:hypothetical protein KF840_05455 [bacterium]|nr:hypothetical protein [bacterium]